MELYTDGKKLIISFHYDPVLVEKVKTLPNRSFDPVTKNWILPLNLDSFYAFRKAFPNAEIDKSVRNFDFNKQANPLLNYVPPSGLSPYKHQIETLKFMLKEKQAAVFNTMGTGKTITSLMALDYLFQNKLIKKALIIAPLLVMNDAWISDCETYFPHLSIQKLSKNQNEAAEGIWIINWDMIKILFDYVIEEDTKGKKIKRITKTFNFDFDCVILDESAKARNVKTKRFEILKRYLPVEYTFILSGLPAPNTPLEYWSQFYLMDGGKTLGVNYWQFLSKHAYKTKFDWFITKDGARAIKEKVVSKSIRFELEDCVDLPENITLWREVELDSEHLRNYDKIENETSSEINYGTIDTSNVAVKASKLWQAASGYVYDDIGRSIALTKNNKKIEALKEIIEEEFGREQVIVFAYFKNQLDEILKSVKGKFSVAAIYGGINSSKSIEDFKTGKIQVLIANPASTGHGLTFTNAKGIIWFTPIWDYEIFEQARKRVQRIGLKHKSLEVFMHAKDTIEYSMYWGLRHKKDMSSIILKSIKEKNKRKKMEGIY